MKITTTKIKAEELEPGDLYSVYGEDYWSTIDRNKYAVGQKVFIRTNAETPEDQKNDIIYKITIKK